MDIYDESQKDYKGGLIYAETWNSYLENFGPSNVVGYLEANDHVAEELELVLNKASTFIELKSELLSFVEKRQKLSKFANDNLP